MGDTLRLPADWREQFHKVEHGAMDSRATAKTVALIESWISSSPLPDSETEPDNWESGAYIEPGIGGVANVSTSGWPGGVNRVWLRVSDYARDNHGADIVLEPDEADEIAAVLRGAAQSVRRDPGVTS